MDPVVAGRSDRFAVATLLNQLLHAGHRLLLEHVEQKSSHCSDQDNRDRDRHLGGATALAGRLPAEAGAPFCAGATAPGSTMNVRIVPGCPSYWNCNSGIGRARVSSL